LSLRKVSPRVKQPWPVRELFFSFRSRCFLVILSAVFWFLFLSFVCLSPFSSLWAEFIGLSRFFPPSFRGLFLLVLFFCETCVGFAGPESVPPSLRHSFSPPLFAKGDHVFCGSGPAVASLHEKFLSFVPRPSIGAWVPPFDPPSEPPPCFAFPRSLNRLALRGVGLVHFGFFPVGPFNLIFPFF